jgi:hypothetical protein
VPSISGSLLCSNYGTMACLWDLNTCVGGRQGANRITEMDRNENRPSGVVAVYEGSRECDLFPVDSIDIGEFSLAIGT